MNDPALCRWYTDFNGKFRVTDWLVTGGYYSQSNVSKLRKDGFGKIGRNSNVSSPQRRNNAAPVDELEM